MFACTYLYSIDHLHLTLLYTELVIISRIFLNSSNPLKLWPNISKHCTIASIPFGVEAETLNLENVL